MTAHPISLHQDLCTAAESRAATASQLPAFSSFNLSNTKRTVTTMLGLIGRSEIFDQYTRHDISHINAMLKMLDWVIPEPTQKDMSPVDWLMTTLAVYFHDLGMLVTRDEYDNRSKSEFPHFKQQLLSNETGRDFKAQLDRLAPDRAERALYQEFVRSNHARRIRTWITGTAAHALGFADPVVSELNECLAGLPAAFRRDLGVICESHHLDDLNDLDKYSTSQPYGNSPAETVNLQYAAILTRTTDLLHISSDRTPSTEFRITNPSDPLSQEEWAKQMAVRSIRSQMGKDKENNLSESAPRDTIEVHAYFTEPRGFFALTSYLKYAESQIRKSHEWAALANKQAAARHRFPWIQIDTAHIQTENFLPQSYEFRLDQGKVLDLLTGHTLYNDSSVVLRELVQNAIDATRLQRLLASSATRDERPIDIEYNPATRTLTITDSGTGMTQETIERHLLKAGSSRYQEPDFKKQHPSFHPISRFGIGVLSCFMVADSVDIFTCSTSDERARHLSLRSVHGRYLIRLVDKHDHEIASIFPHGTRISLQLRASAKLANEIEAIARHWIVVPSVPVRLKIADGDWKDIGAPNISEALIEQLVRSGYEVFKANSQPESGVVSVRRFADSDIEIAFAVQWSQQFREWNFLTPKMDAGDELASGTCVEGIRIDARPPGFHGLPIYAMANACGVGSPKTNVARNGFESDFEMERVSRVAYAAFVDHVKMEVDALARERSFSLTWAAQEGDYMLGALLGGDRGRPVSPNLLRERVGQLPLLVVEHKEERRLRSHAELAVEPIWTADSALVRSAESLIREARNNATMSQLLSVLGPKVASLTSEYIVYGGSTSRHYLSLTLADREVDRVVANKDGRRVDLRWMPRGTSRKWQFVNEHKVPQSIMRELRSRRRYGSIFNVFVATESIRFDGLTDEIGVRSSGRIYLRSSNLLAEYLGPILANAEDAPSERHVLLAALLTQLVWALSRPFQSPPTAPAVVRRAVTQLSQQTVNGRIEDFSTEFERAVEVLTACPPLVFDPQAWNRAKTPGGIDLEDFVSYDFV